MLSAGALGNGADTPGIDCASAFLIGRLDWFGAAPGWFQASHLPITRGESHGGGYSKEKLQGVT